MAPSPRDLVPYRVLVVDDERGARLALEVPLRLSGYEVISASGGTEAIELGQRQAFDVVLTDIFMPDVRGIDVVREFRRFSPKTKIIAMTAQGSLEIALEAIAEGAFDVIAKPFDVDEVLALLARATRHHVANSATVRVEEQDFSASGLIGHSPQMVRAYKLTAYAARTQATVLIEGESGTGKELIARAIHNFSDRADKPFTAVNCSAMTETLLESELFGYTRGSFTGAITDRAGLFESTNGGTILLDELATTSQSFQASLLRIIQEREVRRIGGRESRRVDVRIIGATNTDLEQLVERGEFRRDLFYRLSVLVIKLPPLRERGEEDVAQLTRHFLQKCNQRAGRETNITDEAVSVLGRYLWPGNVRELENTIEHAIAICSDNLITTDDLPAKIAAGASEDQVKASPPPVSICDDRPTLEELNRRYIRLVLAESNGNKSRAADVLGINRRTLYRYLESPESHRDQLTSPDDES